MSDDLLSGRAGALSAHATVTQAAILAADLAGAEGFRPTDVRFFFLLFTNWMEDDHLHPGVDLDATQVRRTLAHLQGAGLARGLDGRPPRWALTRVGVVQLVEALTDPATPRRFEEVVLLATVAALYVDTIAARVREGQEESGPRPGGGADVRRVRARLDPRAILATERRRLATALADLDARREGAAVLGEAARAALVATGNPIAAARRVEAERPPYQLHPMRSFHEVIASLPPRLQQSELERGWELRARYLFGPLAESLRARIGILERLEARIREG